MTVSVKTTAPAARAGRSLPNAKRLNQDVRFEQLAERLAERVGEQLPDALAQPLADALVERTARRVVELLHAEGEPDSMLSAAEVARRVGRSRDWVYRHADTLAAVRLGDGERPRLAFDPAKVADYLATCSTGREPEPPSKPAAKPRSSKQGRSTNGQRTASLAIRGSALPDWSHG